jgi:DNA polymerase elongation subunit (family B)
MRRFRVGDEEEESKLREGVGKGEGKEGKRSASTLLDHESDGTLPISTLQAHLQSLSTLFSAKHYRMAGDTTAGSDAEMFVVRTEVELFHTFLTCVRLWDPDIIVGWEVQQLSVGYLLQRATVIGVPLAQGITRAPEAPPQ